MLNYYFNQSVKPFKQKRSSGTTSIFLLTQHDFHWTITPTPNDSTVASLYTVVTYSYRSSTHTHVIYSGAHGTVYLSITCHSESNTLAHSLLKPNSQQAGSNYSSCVCVWRVAAPSSPACVFIDFLPVIGLETHHRAERVGVHRKYFL